MLKQRRTTALPELTIQGIQLAFMNVRRAFRTEELRQSLSDID